MAINLDEIRKKHEQLSKKGNSSSNEDFNTMYVQIPEGDIYVRILPGKNEEDQFYSETKIHRLPGENNSVVNVHCLKVHGKACPLCDLYYSLYKVHNEKVKSNPSLKKDGTPESNLANKIRARDRYYMNVIDRRDDKGAKPRILSIGKILFGVIISTMLDKDFGDVTDLATGRDLKIVKTIEKDFPKYTESRFRPLQEVAGTPAEIAVWMESLHDLTKLVREEDYEKVKKMAEAVAVGKAIVVPKDKKELTDEEFEAKMRGD